jgi:DnaK suppressor protein
MSVFRAWPKGHTPVRVGTALAVLMPPGSRQTRARVARRDWLANCTSRIVMPTSTNRDARLQDLRASLLAERDKIMSDRQSRLQVLVTPENTAAEDQAPLLHDQFVAITHHSRDRDRLAWIEAALERFQSGQFGTCEECERPIPLKRLQAIPWALYCVPCQEQLEQVRAVPEQDLLFSA